MDKEPFEIINSLEAGRFARLGRIVPAGTLEARLEKTGAVRFYWRGAVGSKTVRVPIGMYDRRASPKSVRPTPTGYSIAAAKQAAITIASQHVDHRSEGGIAAVRTAKREQARKAHEAHEEAAKYTLARLLDAYCDHLKAQEKSSHSDARSIFQLHIKDPYPDLAARSAAAVTNEEIIEAMRRLLDVGKGRTANKLRAYVRAAFQLAMDARMDATIPASFKAFGVRHNPAAETRQSRKHNRADKNPLLQDDLLTYWRVIKDMPGLRGAALRLHLLTGGQRIAQLVRLQVSDVGKDRLTLYDGKGRPGTEPRTHVLPLIPAARQALDVALSVERRGEYALSTDGGITHLAPTTLSDWAKEAAGDHLPGFTAKRIRSGVETLLAARKVTKDIRGRLQSHGISGIQDRHYDGHDYLAEKRQALMILFNTLEPKKAKVTPIRSIAA